METHLDLPQCESLPSRSGGCGCGCSGDGEIAAGVASLPWWVWLAAVGLFVAVSGNQKTVTRAFVGGRSRARGRRR